MNTTMKSDSAPDTESTNASAILVQAENGILSISINRPEKKNALTSAMYQAMADALRAAETDKSVRVIVISGKPDAFTAGNDLEDFMKNAALFSSEEGGVNPAAPVFQFMRALNESSKPVIAAVAGVAVGIGTTLLMHCDLVYFAENAKLAMPFTPLGLCPEFASSLVLPQIMGSHKAAEKLLFGEPFSAQEAFELGLGNKVLALEELLPYAMQQAAKIVALPAASIRMTKKLMRNVSAVSSTMQEENLHFAAMLKAQEAREAMTAFLQKRKPDFSQFD